MGSRLVYDVANALAEAGHPVLRFDFRGVNRSEGVYAQGVGETDDAAACFDELHSRLGRVPLVVGYSFGAAVALRMCRRRKPVRIVTLGLPLPVLESALRPQDDALDVVCPVDMVLGDQDPYVTVEAARNFASTFAPPAHVHVVAGAGHFLEPSHNPRAVQLVLAALGDAST